MASTIADFGFMLLKEMSSSLKFRLYRRDSAICATKRSPSITIRVSGAPRKHESPLVRGCMTGLSVSCFALTLSENETGYASTGSPERGIIPCHAIGSITNTDSSAAEKQISGSLPRRTLTSLRLAFYRSGNVQQR